MKRPSLTRRDFLKLGSVSLAGALLPKDLITSLPTERLKLGRVTGGTLPLYEQPSFSARKIAHYWQDMILPISKQVEGDSDLRNTSAWYLVGRRGYTPVAGLQPVEVRFQEPTADLRFTGTLAEVSVPFLDVHYTFSSDSPRLYRYYYGSTHWINKMVHDRDGRAWYRVFDDKFPERERWVPADRLRVFTDEELAPISPEVPAEEKQVEVSLEEQQVTAYEAGEMVFQADISTGDALTNPKYQTPTGQYLVGLKRASQHMMPWDRTFGSYDLPGVPWVSYFTAYAHAFHGAYWHNAFGRVRSHGCVNLAPEDAKWLYLWSTPVMRPYNQLQYLESGGTRVVVV